MLVRTTYRREACASKRLRLSVSFAFTSVLIYFCWLQYIPQVSMDKFDKAESVLDFRDVPARIETLDGELIQLTGVVENRYYVFNRGIFLLKDLDDDYSVSIITHYIPPTIGDTVSIVVEVQLLVLIGNSAFITFRMVEIDN